MPARAKLRALVLRTVDYGESDRVVELLSEERGKLSVFARGARASRRRFAGALELGTLLAVEVAERPGAELATLESAAVERAFGAVRGDLARIACAAYACDLARALVRDHEPHPDLFGLLAGYLDLLDRKPAAPGSLRAYELGALRAAGLAPRLDDCARCGGRLPGSPARLAVGLDEGGFLCGSCGPPNRPGPRCGPAAAAALRRLAAVGPEGAGPLEEDVGAEAREMLTAFIEHQLGKRLPSRKFLDEVGPMLKP